MEGPKLVGSSLENVIGAYKTVGYQATNVGVALEELEAMLAWRMCDDQVALNTARKHGEVSDEEARGVRTKIFLGATTALFLAGSREAINFLCKHRMVDVIVTPGGGIDFDILRALHPEHVTVGAGYGGAAPGTSTQGNLSVKEPESRNAVVAFVVEILEAEAAKAKSAADLVFTPSSFVKVMGSALHARGLHSSCIAWAAVNNLPVYSPSLVDGWVGEAFYEFNKKRQAAQLPTAKLDLVTDVRLMNTEATSAKHTGMLILGGGVVKHHICNANLMRNGADHSVLIGTGQVCVVCGAHVH